jgi:hypothetical protein
MRTSAPVTRVEVSVETDHLEKLTRPGRRLAGIAELVWNALDAEADRVSVRVIENALQGVDVIEVIDNGHGMLQTDALHDFELLGGSWKRHQRRSKNGKRLVHGSEGECRWRAFSLGDLVRWVSVADTGARREKVTITGERSALKEFEIGEVESTEDPIGTTVIVENIREGVAGSVLADDATDVLSAEFALYLEMYPDIEIRYRRADLPVRAWR